jgi:outer membrane biosynthesis protein TonB
MSVAGSENLAPRPSAKPLLWALLISLAVHLVALVLIPLVYVALVALAIIAKPPNPAQLQHAQQKQNPVVEELPLEFVEVDPTQATKEAPKDAKYYSSRNAKAANPDAKVETKVPKIDGTQTHVPRTETVEKPKAFPLQPSFPKTPAPEQKEEAKAKAAPKIGDLAMVKPADKPADKTADAQVEEPPKHVRPRTIAEAEAQNNSILGEKMKQDGGVKGRHITSSFDTKATAFGAYDAAFIEAVQQHWYDLIDSQNASQLSAGRVVLEFNLNYDGRITDMKVIASDVNGLMTYLCEQAVLDPAPYEKWPSDMRRIIGSDRREVRFTFYYQ